MAFKIRTANLERRIWLMLEFWKYNLISINDVMHDQDPRESPYIRLRRVHDDLGMSESINGPGGDLR